MFPTPVVFICFNRFFSIYFSYLTSKYHSRGFFACQETPWPTLDHAVGHGSWLQSFEAQPWYPAVGAPGWFAKKNKNICSICHFYQENGFCNVLYDFVLLRKRCLRNDLKIFCRKFGKRPKQSRTVFHSPPKKKVRFVLASL